MFLVHVIYLAYSGCIVLSCFINDLWKHWPRSRRFAALEAARGSAISSRHAGASLLGAGWNTMLAQSFANFLTFDQCLMGLASWIKRLFAFTRETATATTNMSFRLALCFNTSWAKWFSWQVTGFDEHRYSESARFILDQAGMNYLNCNAHSWPFDSRLNYLSFDMPPLFPVQYMIWSCKTAHKHGAEASYDLVVFTSV